MYLIKQTALDQARKNYNEAVMCLPRTLTDEAFGSLQLQYQEMYEKDDSVLDSGEGCAEPPCVYQQWAAPSPPVEQEDPYLSLDGTDGY